VTGHNVVGHFGAGVGRQHDEFVQSVDKDFKTCHTFHHARGRVIVQLVTHSGR
jgi:hypothetical protein